MQLTALPNNEAAILSRLGEPDQPTFPREAAEAILTLDLSPADKERVDALAAKARAGTLTRKEQAEVEAYSRVGSLLGILQSKARRSLKNGGGAGRTKAH